MFDFERFFISMVGSKHAPVANFLDTVFLILLDAPVTNDVFALKKSRFVGLADSGSAAGAVEIVVDVVSERSLRHSLAKHLLLQCITSSVSHNYFFQEYYILLNLNLR